MLCCACLIASVVIGCTKCVCFSNCAVACHCDAVHLIGVLDVFAVLCHCVCLEGDHIVAVFIAFCGDEAVARPFGNECCH